MENLDSNTRNESIEKPSVLYIGSTVRGVKEFRPRRNRYRDKDEGPVIFSTPDKALASIFTIEEHGDGYTKIGYYNDVLVLLIKDNREDFLSKDNGGSIYEVSSDSFDCDDNKGMREKEWTSREKVKSKKEEKFNSTLDTMVGLGVQVYFVDEDVIKKVSNSTDYGLSILRSIESENKLRNKNIKKI